MRNGAHYRRGSHSVHRHKSKRKHVEYYKRRLVFSLILTLPLILLMEPLRSLTLKYIIPYTLIPGLTLIFMSAVYLYGGWPFLNGMYRELVSKRLGMMTLVSLGITASLLYGFIEVFLGREPSMGGELAFLVLVMLIGHWAEMKYAASASKALKELASLIPSKATLIRDGEVVEIPVNELKEGNLVLIRPGERVPSDGIIVSGRANVDESLLTGESKPVFKKEGDRVIGGSLNLDGAIKVAIDKTGEETFLAQVMRLVKQAQESKTAIQTLADRGAAFLTIVAITVAIVALTY